MNINELFPSKFLKAADLNGRTKTLIINGVLLEDITGDGKPEDHKAVLRFKDTEKSLVLNKTNAMTISAALGENTESWTGKRVEVFPTVTLFQGRSVDCLRVRMPEFDDDIPAFTATPNAA